MTAASTQYGQFDRLEPFRAAPSARRSVQRETDRQIREALQGLATYAKLNDSEAKAVVGRMEDLVVGPDGPRVEWETGDAEFDRTVAGEWERYAFEIGGGAAGVGIDARRMRDLPGLLRQCVGACFGSGRFGWNAIGAAGDGSTDGTAHDSAGSVQLIDGVRIMNPGAGVDTDDLVAGVELDRVGAPVGLHVARWSAGGLWLNYDTEPVGFGRGAFGYVPDPMATEIDLIAPPPALTSAVVPIVELAACQAAVVHAMMKEAADGTYIETDEPLDNDLTGLNDSELAERGFRRLNDGRIVEVLEADAMRRLRPGERIASVASQYPQQALASWVKSQLIRVGAPYGLTYELLTGDFAGTNFSASKLSSQLTGRRVGVLASGLIASFLRPVITQVFIPAMILRERIDPRRLPDGWDRPTITPAPMPDPDPQKTSVRVLTDFKTGMRTLRQNARERGQSYETYTAELAEDIAFLREQGLTHPMGQPVQLVQSGDGPDNGSDDSSQPLPGERAGGEMAGGGGRGENATGDTLDTTGDG